jgi:leucyl aminopeptidase
MLSTGFLGEDAGAQDSLLVGDIVGDGRTKALLNDGMGGLLLIDLAPGSDTQAPTVALTSPAPGALVDGAVTLEATAADDWGVERVEFYVDGAIIGTDAHAPFSASWDTVPFDAGPLTLEARAYDFAGHVTSSAPVTVSVKDAGGDAQYDILRAAPTCAKPSTFCDSGSLLVGRRQIGPEPHYPNTVNGSCPDGSGSFPPDSSNDRILVQTLDGLPFSPGKRVRVRATFLVGLRDPGGPALNKRVLGYRLDVFAAADASAPAWFLVATRVPTQPGAQTLTAEYTLPAGPLQVVRAQMRYLGSAVPCEQGPRNDHDDLVFTVK